jgi:hypothetical protein
VPAFSLKHIRRRGSEFKDLEGSLCSAHSCIYGGFWMCILAAKTGEPTSILLIGHPSVKTEAWGVLYLFK